LTLRLAYKWQASLIVALGLFMAILDNTIVSVTLPQMLKAFHTDFETITWVVTGYFLAQAAVIPLVGYLSDRIGTKFVFLASLALFTLGSALTTYLTQQAAAHANDVLAALHTSPLTGVAATCAATAGRNAQVLKACVGQQVSTMALNDTFVLVLIVCAVCVALALFVGRDPAIEAAKRAGESEEQVEEKAPVMSE